MNGIILIYLTQCLLYTSFLNIFIIADTLQAQASPVTKHLAEDDLLGIVRRLELLESSNNDLKGDNRKLKEDVTSLKDYISLLEARNQEQITNLQSEIIELQTKNQQNQLKLQSFLSAVQSDELEQLYSFNSQKNIFDDINKNLINDTEPQTEQPRPIQGHERPIGAVKNYGAKTKVPAAIQGLRNDKNQKRLVDQGSRITRAENEVTVAFYATVGAHHIEHVGVNQAIKFDDVITNIGNAYNKFAGDFRAPVDGTYVFSVTLMAYDTHTTHYHIAQNGQGKGNIYLRGQDSAEATSALTAILELKQGDNVTIQNTDPDEYLYGYAYSTFSGFLLQQNFPSSAIIGK